MIHLLPTLTSYVSSPQRSLVEWHDEFHGMQQVQQRHPCPLVKVILFRPHLDFGTQHYSTESTSQLLCRVPMCPRRLCRKAQPVVTTTGVEMTVGQDMKGYHRQLVATLTDITRRPAD